MPARLRVLPALRPLAALAALALAAGCDAGSTAPSAVDRVVVVTVDTLRADHVGSYGARRAHTPALDGLARTGVRFETAIAPTPITLPSHTSLWTGLDPPHHGVRNNSIFRLPDDVPTVAERFRAAGFATAAFVGAVVLDRQHGLDRGFQVYDDRMSARMAAGDQGFSERRADVVVDAALGWLADAPERFLLWVHLYDPHGNYDPPAGFAAAFPGDPYAGEIAFADAQLARLFQALDARFDPAGTLLVATSDHGESLGEHGEISHSLTLYDATQRVPLLVRGPGFPAGRVVHAPAALVDLAPTLLAAAGLAPLPGAAGTDLRAAGDTGTPAERFVYLETLVPQIDFGWSPILGLRSADRKYLRAPRPELYDLRTDPDELRNLAAERPEVVAALDARLAARLEGTRSAPGVRPDERTREQLEALGYVVSPSAGTRDDLGRVGGLDVKDGLPRVQTLLVAMTLQGAGRDDEALALLAPLGEGGFMLASTRAQAALGAERPEEAEAHARAAIRAAPRFAEGHALLGQALLAQGRREEAAAAYGDARRLDVASAAPLVGLGRVAEADGDRERAEALYAEAERQRGGSAEARWRRAALRIEDGDTEGADALLAELPPEALDEPDAALRLARAEKRAGLAGRARRRIERALEKRPEAPGLRRAAERLAADGR